MADGSLRIEMWENSYSVANNTSSVTVQVWLDTNYAFNGHSPYGKITFGGNAAGVVAFWSSFSSWTSNLLKEHTHDVVHNADGSGWVSVDVMFESGVSMGTMYASKSINLTTIPRASTPSVSGSTMGSPITIYTNRASSSFTHTLKYNFNGHQAVIAENVGASTTWTPPLSTFAAWCTDATSKSCTIICNTYNGGTLIGTKETSFTLSVPTSVVPSISSVAVTDSAGYLSTYGGYVQTKSIPKVTTTAAGIYGSTISRYEVTFENNVTAGTANSYTLLAPKNTGSQTVAVKVKDTRGRTATKSATINVIAYSVPSFTVTAQRYNTSTGKYDDESTTVRVVISGTITNVGSKGINKATVVSIQYKLSSASSYTTSVSNVALTGTSSVSYTKDLTGLSELNAYDIRVNMKDSLGSSSTYDIFVNTAEPVMDVTGAGDGLAFFGIAEPDKIKLGKKVHIHESLGFGDSSGNTVEFLEATSTGRPVITNHTSLANGIYLQGQLSSGTSTDILGMNSSNQVELNWTSGGLRGRVMKLLWSGTLSQGGSVTVSEFAYYNMFCLIATNEYDTETQLLLARDRIGGYMSSSSYFYDVNGAYLNGTAATFTTSTKLTVTWINSTRLSDGDVLSLQVKQIYGVL